jgi:hypothetical protein
VHPLGVDPDEHWILDIHAVEWLFLAKKIVTTVPPADQEAGATIMPLVGGDVRFYLATKVFPAAVVGRFLGKEPGALKPGVAIVLTAKPRPDLPAPTVEYWGTA